MEKIFASFTAPYTINSIPAGAEGELAIIQNSKGHHYLARWNAHPGFGLPAYWRPVEGNEVDPDQYKTVFAVLLGYGFVKRDPARPNKWAFNCHLIEVETA